MIEAAVQGKAAACWSPKLPTISCSKSHSDETAAPRLMKRAIGHTRRRIEPGRCTQALGCDCLAENYRELAILLEVTPAIQPPLILSRRLRVLVGRVEALDVEVFRSEAFLIDVVGGADTDTDIIVSLEFGAAVTIAGDNRPLAFAFHRVSILGVSRPGLSGRCSAATIFPTGSFEQVTHRVEQAVGLPAPEFLMGFESLGNTCDFGFLYRKCGAEPLGLLRFAGLDTVDLVRGLLDRFARLGTPGSTERLALPGTEGEYFLRERACGIGSHTFISQSEAAPEQLTAREAWRLPFLRRLVLENVDEARKTFILRRAEGLHISQVEAVATALRLHGEGKLLWAVQEMGRQPGSVDVLSPYLMRGNLDIIEGPGSSSFEAWLCICANAYLLQRALGA